MFSFDSFTKTNEIKVPERPTLGLKQSGLESKSVFQY